MPTDPVCGLFVRDEGGAPEVEVGGHRYLFCSRGCLRRFTAPERERAGMQRSAALALGAGAALAALPLLGALPEPALGLLLLALASAVQALAGWPFYAGVRHALAARAPNMDALVALGTTAAWLFGAVEVLAPELLVQGRQQYYFEVGALVLGFLALGRLLEQRLGGEANHEVRRLLDLQPVTALVERDGSTAEVPLDAIAPDDIVVVQGGERVPVDGLVVEGRSAVDEKLLTGESVPVDKRAGDHVLGGSVNVGGKLRVRATRVGGETALAKIVALIADAQTAAPRRRFVDTLSAWLFPLTVGLALLAFAGWWLVGGKPLPFAFGVFVTVLLIACPTALGLAVPAALRVGVARGVQEGILTKDPGVLERVQSVDLVVFDKTGTLTRGEPALTDAHALEGDERELLALAASAEADSEHPLAKTLVRAAQAKRLKLLPTRKARVLAGLGVEAVVGGEEVLVGSPRLFRECRIKSEAADILARRLQDEGKTVVLVAREQRLVGVLAFSDPLKPEAAVAVQRLQAMGIEVALVTGDTARTAAAVGKELGLRRTFAEITPHGKAAVVKALQEGGRKVAMVGDGVNDAPALAQADVGVALGGGAEVAMGAADLVLMKNDPRDIPMAIAISQRTFRGVQQNVYWASGYVLAFLPLAALGLLNPLLAGAAMAFSAVPVVANAARLQRAWDREHVAH